MRPGAALELRDVTVQFGGAGRFGGAGGVSGLDRIQFELGGGEQAALIGRSGSGKSTLARCAAGWLAPDSGTVIARGSVGLLPQDSPRFLNPRWTVRRIIQEPEAIAGRALPEVRLREMLARTGLPGSCLDLLPWQLSTGQRQRVAIARLLLGPPFDALVLDEPFTGQDPRTRDQLWPVIEEARADLGFAVLHIGHDLRWLREVCGRVLVLEVGTVVEDCAGPGCFDRLQHPASLALVRAADSLEVSAP